MNDELLTFEEALTLLGMSAPTLYKQLREKKIDGYLIAGKWKFKREQIDDYLEGCRNLKDANKDNCR